MSICRDSDCAGPRKSVRDEERSTHRERVDEHMAAKVAQWGPDVMRYVEKTILLQTLDHLWREHLVMLRSSAPVIALRGYGQRDPLQEYNRNLQPVRGNVAHLREAVTAAVDARRNRPPEEQQRSLPSWKCTSRSNTGEDELAFCQCFAVPTASAAAIPKIRQLGQDSVATRQSCGSGKKYKHCHGKNGVSCADCALTSSADPLAGP